MAALKYWVWLTNVPGLTNRSRWLLLDHFQSPEEIYYAQEEQLLLVEGMTTEQAALLRQKSLQRADEILAECAAKDIFIVTVQDAAYPSRLRNIYDAPLLLYGKGAMPLFDEEAAIAVVGTRDCTPYGVHAAEELGYGLARQGALIVSGLAKGIDAAASRGALRAGGVTVGVLGNGIDIHYPAESRYLYEDVAAAGALISEYPPGTEPAKNHFPARNRIISGLCLATLVVEAPERSGALITAETANEQGRDVFAVPGPIDAPASIGCNRLIRDGAGMVCDAWDILREYEARFPEQLRKTGAREEPKTLGYQARQQEEPKAVPPSLSLSRSDVSLTDDQIALLRILSGEEPALVDDLIEQTEIPARRVLSALTVLEIENLVQQHSGKRYTRAVTLID